MDHSAEGFLSSLSPWCLSELSETEHKRDVHFESVELWVVNGEKVEEVRGQGSMSLDSQGFAWSGHVKGADSSSLTPIEVLFRADELVDVEEVDPSALVGWVPTVQVIVRKEDEESEERKVEMQFRFQASDDSMEQAFLEASRLAAFLVSMQQSAQVKRQLRSPPQLSHHQPKEQSFESTDKSNWEIDLSSDEEDFTRRDKKRKSERRGSLSFDAFNEVFEEEELQETRQSVPEQQQEPANFEEEQAARQEPANFEEERTENMTPVETETECPSTPPHAQQPIDSEEALRQLVRAYVRSPDRTGIVTQQELQERHSYHLSLVSTPTKKRVQDSPLKGRQPTRAELKALKPIVVQMTELSKEENAKLEAATNVRFGSKGGHGANQYIDCTTNDYIIPSEYARRYMQHIQGQTVTFASPPLKPQSTPSTPVVAEQTCQSTAGRTPVPVKKSSFEADKENKSAGSDNNIRMSNHINKGVLESGKKKASVVEKERGMVSTFEEEIAQAEAELHAAFEQAMEKFLSTKRHLEYKHSRNVSILSPLVSDASTTATNHNKSPEPGHQDKSERRKSSTLLESRQHASRRRKSITPDAVLDLMSAEGVLEDKDKNTVANQVSPPSKRVIWSAKGI